MYETVEEYLGRIRKGEGPAFLEILTCRWKEHVGPSEDYHLGYRAEDEVARWIENDELRKLAAMIDIKERESMEAELEREIKDAFDFAEQSAFPAADALFDDVFKET
jgi:TPP-dependent pyruvate/acetoin dehydrogenase alpha subunit